MTTERPYHELTIDERAQVAARFRDDLFASDSSAYLYEFTTGGLFRRPIHLAPARSTRAKANPQVVIFESGKPVITPALMDIMINAYFNHIQENRA